MEGPHACRRASQSGWVPCRRHAAGAPTAWGARRPRRPCQMPPCDPAAPVPPLPRLLPLPRLATARPTCSWEWTASAVARTAAAATPAMSRCGHAGRRACRVRVALPRMRGWDAVGGNCGAAVRWMQWTLRLPRPLQRPCLARLGPTRATAVGARRPAGMPATHDSGTESSGPGWAAAAAAAGGPSPGSCRCAPTSVWGAGGDCTRAGGCCAAGHGTT